MKTLTHLQSRIFDTPLAISPEKLDVILQAIGPRFGLPWTAENVEQLNLLAGSYQSDAERKSYYVTEDGIACLPIQGTLMKKASGLMGMSGCSSYEKIACQLQTCLDDPNVTGILLDVDSPGGETHGMFELCDFIYSSRGSKPIYASINDHALSAAYCLASSASKLFITQTGAAGSIGVFALHIDQSAADEKAGLKYTYVHAGKKKVEGNPHVPLSKSARSDTQTEVDREYAMFVDAVARNRRLAYDAVQETEAGVYFAESAIAAGLADEIGTCDDALAAITEAVTGIPADDIDSTGRADRANNSLKGASAAMPAIPPHKTAVDRGSWDGPAAKKNLKADQGPSYYNKAFAFRDDSMDTNTKSAYSYIHHRVNATGDIGPASLVACRTGIGILNGGRGGGGRQAYSKAERSGIYRHLAKHVKDAGEDPSPLKSYEEYLTQMSALAEQLNQQGETMASKQLIDDLALVAKRSEAEDADDADYMKKGKKSKRAEDTEDADDAEGKKARKAEDADDADDADEAEEGKKKSKRAESAESADDADDAEDGKRMKKGSKKSKRASTQALLLALLAEAKKKDDDEDEEDEPDDDEDDEDDDEAPKKKPSGKRAQAQAIEIIQACHLAGMSNLAAGFIAKGYSILRVQQILVDKRAAQQRKEVEAAGGYIDGNFGASAGSRSSALDTMEQQVQVLIRNSGGKLSKPAAYEQLLKANPGLYEQYETEREDAGRSRGARREYLQSMQRTMQRMGLGRDLSGIPDNLPQSR